MNMELITSAASDALVNVVLAIIALAGAYGVYYIRLGAAKLKEQTAQIKDEAGRKVLEDALDDVVNLATVSVGAMEQTTAKALRDAVKNGTASREELLALGKQVFDEVKAAIAPEAQQVITDNLGSFDKYLTAVIEDAVLHIKNEDPYAEDVRVKNKIIRETRKEGLLLLNDDIDLEDVQGELETRAKFMFVPLQRMIDAKEISSAEITVPEGQAETILEDETMRVKIRYVSRGYIREVEVDLGRAQPSE